MFRTDAIGVLAFVFIVTVVLGQRVLTLLLGLLLFTLWVAERYSRVALQRVSIERQLSQDHAFIGDKVALTIRASNPKILGIPSLQCGDLAPARLRYSGVVRPSSQPNTQVLMRTVAVRAYEAVSWRVDVTCLERGLHTFGPIELTASDPFGLYHTTNTIPGIIRLVVYPRLVNLPDSTLLPRQPIGDRRTQRQLLTDPVRTVGVRDYSPTDPFKTIHWKATARRGALQTRVFEPTSTLDLVIVLDLDTFEHYFEGVRPDLVEYLIGVAATLATAADRGKWSFGLYANGGAVDSDQLIRLAPSRHPGQLGAVLEALAKLVPFSVIGLPLLLRRIGSSLPIGATVIIISAVGSPEVQSALVRLATPHSGAARRIRWLYAGDGATPQVPGIEVRALPHDAEWQTPRMTEIGVG